MGCLRNGHRFSAVNALEDLVWAVIASAFLVWILFVVDRNSCTTTVVYQLDGTTPAFLIPCNLKMLDDRVFESGWVWGGLALALAATWLFLSVLDPRPYDICVVQKPIHHCTTCVCHGHIDRPGRVYPPARTMAERERRRLMTTAGDGTEDG
jgi:hypothetical protein